MVSPELA
jgi:hypothetical protein